MNESTLVPRKELSDLDWLARNVHEWPAGEHQPWCYVYWKDGRRAVSGNCIPVIQPYVRIEKFDWLARRAELQNKPSFTDHLDAKCFVQNNSGTWFKNRNSTNIRPESNGGWFDRDMSCGWTQLGAGEVLGDWRDTLEKRPANLSEQAVTARLNKATDNVLAAVPKLMADKYKFTPFISIEDNQEKNMKQDNGWFERGDLPPVGIECDIRHSCWNSEKYEKVTVAAITNEYLIVKYVTLEQHYMLKDISFRPIRTERDVLIEMLADFDGSPASAGAVADAILTAGFSLGAK